MHGPARRFTQVRPQLNFSRWSFRGLRLCGLTNLPKPKHTSCRRLRQLLELGRRGLSFLSDVGRRVPRSSKMARTVGQLRPRRFARHQERVVATAMHEAVNQLERHPHNKASAAMTCSYLTWRAKVMSSASFRRPVSCIISTKRLASSTSRSAGASRPI